MNENLAPSADDETIIGYVSGVDFVNAMRGVTAENRLAVINYIAGIFCLKCGVERDLLPNRVCHCENDE